MCESLNWDRKMLNDHVGLCDFHYFSVKNEEDFNREYAVGQVLGNGGFGTVYAGVRKEDGKRVSLLENFKT